MLKRTEASRERRSLVCQSCHLPPGEGTSGLPKACCVCHCLRASQLPVATELLCRQQPLAPLHHAASRPWQPGPGLRFAMFFSLLEALNQGLSPQSGHNLVKDNWPNLVSHPVYLLCKMPSRQLSPALTKPGMMRGRGSVLCSRKAGVQELKGVQNHAVAETDRRQDRQPHTHMWRELERDRFRFYKAVHRTDAMNLLAGTSSSPHPTIYQPHRNMAVTSLAL